VPRGHGGDYFWHSGWLLRVAFEITVVPYPASVSAGNMQIVVWQFWGRAAGSVLNREV
jgi:hypothetical protein